MGEEAEKKGSGLKNLMVLHAKLSRVFFVLQKNPFEGSETQKKQHQVTVLERLIRRQHKE